MAERLPLVGQACRRTGSGGLLSDGDIAGYLGDLPGWVREGDTLRRRLCFPDFHHTMAFVNAVAWIAHRQDHHPDLAVGYGHCELRFTTHDAGGLTLNDFICAAHVNALLT